MKNNKIPKCRYCSHHKYTITGIMTHHYCGKESDKAIKAHEAQTSPRWCHKRSHQKPLKSTIIVE